MHKGTISVQTENIFPIIKKFLYSDHEIFLRELVSNAVDATTKLRSLVNRGDAQADLNDLSIEILLDPEAKTLTIRDRGIGMTEEEVQRYLNQIAFSSAREFLEKYQNETIIGNFGLGFYSAFMVADRVEVLTRSFQPDAAPVRWSCDGSPEYELGAAEKEFRGTDVTLFISEENKEFLEEPRILELLEKYCRFLPVEIRFGTKKETVTTGEGETAKEETIEVPRIINNTQPVWKKNPADLKDEDYTNFYKELYPFSPDPLFWIHLNIDFPFNLTGVLYFPKVSNAFELQKNKIHLYCNQVYVTDEVKDIIPEFLMLLHGVIDSPDIPLNVSRSYLQSDQNVKKITGYITRKVADKLAELFKSDRKAFEAKWNDIGIFVKYGMISDEKFYEKAVSFGLLKNTAGEFFSPDEYREKVKANQTDKNDRIVFLYTNLPKVHHGLIESAKTYGYDVLEMDQVIDSHFMQHLEYKLGNVHFARIDSDTMDNLVQKDEKRESVLSEADQNKVKEWMTAAVANDRIQIELKPLSPDDQPVQITRPEFIRRMQEMQAMQGMRENLFGDHYNVIVNTNHPLIGALLREGKDPAASARYLYQLALLSQHMLDGAQLNDFIRNSLQQLQQH